MPIKLVLISEKLSAPLDEGLKNLVYRLALALRTKCEILVLTTRRGDIKAFDTVNVSMDKLFLNRTLQALIKKNNADSVLYIPEASTTFNSFLRGKILRLCCKGVSVLMIGAQPRRYFFWQKALLRVLKPDILFLLGEKQRLFFEKMGFNVKILSPAVDTKTFLPVDGERKKRLRRQYGVEGNKDVILHVGHIKPNRNIEQFFAFQAMNNYQVIIVGSTTTRVDDSLKQKLIDSGVKVIDSYVPAIEELYQLADIYVFPVLQHDAAIEMPLSVLEAMACNLPVACTPFGDLVEHFNEDECFRYFQNTNELLSLIPILLKSRVTNVEKVAKFTWDNMAQGIISALENLR